MGALQGDSPLLRQGTGSAPLAVVAAAHEALAERH